MVKLNIDNIDFFSELWEKSDIEDVYVWKIPTLVLKLPFDPLSQVHMHVSL